MRKGFAAIAFFAVSCAAQSAPPNWPSSQIEPGRGAVAVEILFGWVKDSKLIDGSQFGGLANFMYGASERIGLNLKFGMSTINHFVRTPPGGVTLDTGEKFTADDVPTVLMFEGNVGYELIEHENLSLLMFGGIGAWTAEGKAGSATLSGGASATAASKIEYDLVSYAQLGIQATFKAGANFTFDPYVAIGVPLSGHLWEDVVDQNAAVSTKYKLDWFAGAGIGGTYRFSENVGVTIGVWWMHMAADWTALAGEQDWNNYGVKIGVAYWF